MKINRVEFDAEQNPCEVTVTMTIEEAAMLTRHASNLRPVDWPDDYPALSALSSCLGGYVFNPYWEDGENEYWRAAR